MNDVMYPYGVALGKTDTSREAAERIDVKTRLRQVLAVICQRPSTADEIADALGVTVLTTRPRTTNLKALGLIYDTGERRKNATGRNCIVYAATGEQGELF